MKTPIFILGLSDTGLYTAQSIGRYKVPIIGFDHNIENPGFHSRYIQGHLVPNPFLEPQKVLSQLIAHVTTASEKPILIPSSEAYIGFIYFNRDELEKYFRIDLPTNDILQNILNKSGQFELANHLNITVPNYWIVTNHEEFNKFLIEYSSQQIIIKALDQTIWKAKVDRRAYISDQIEEIKSIGNNMIINEIPFIIQTIIDSPCTNNFEFNALMLNGRIIEKSIIKKIRQFPPVFGAASCIETTDNVKIDELGSKFIIENKIEGFSNTEFKFNPTDNQYYFIETNTRVWQQIRLTEADGQNFVKSYYDIVNGSSVTSSPSKKKMGTKWIDIFADFMTWKRYLSKENISLRDYLFSLKGVKNFGLLNFHDLRPFLNEIKKIINRRAF